MFTSPKIEKKEICKSGIFILDDVLSDNQLDNLRVGLKVLGEDNRKNRYLRKWNDIKFAHPLLKIVSKYKYLAIYIDESLTMDEMFT